MREVLDAQGVDGVIQLAEMGKAAVQVGWLMAREILDEAALVISSSGRCRNRTITARGRGGTLFLALCGRSPTTRSASASCGS